MSAIPRHWLGLVLLAFVIGTLVQGAHPALCQAGHAGSLHAEAAFSQESWTPHEAEGNHAFDCVLCLFDSELGFAHPMAEPAHEATPQLAVVVPGLVVPPRAELGYASRAPPRL